MGGGGNFCALLMELLQNRHGERSAFDRVGARAQLVNQHKAVCIRLVQNADDVGHMRGESGEGLLNALLIPNIREHMCEDGNTALIRDRDHQTAHRHQREQAHGFDGYGLAARIGAGNHQRIKGFTQADIRGDDLLFYDQWVPCTPKLNNAFVI